MNVRSFLSMAVLAGALTVPTISSAIGIYDSRTGGQVVFSQGFACCQLTELGDHIGFAGTQRSLTTVIVTLTNFQDAFTHPVTLNLYNVHTGSSAGQLIATRTVNANAPASPSPGNTGIPFDVTFDFTGVVVPDQIMYGLTFTNSNSVPSDPGDWDGLNFALWDYFAQADGGDGQSIPVGTDVGTVVNGPTDVTTVVYGRTTSSTDWTSSIGNSLDGGYTPSIIFNAADVVDIPAPAGVAVIGFALVGLGLSRRRMRA